VSAVDDDYEEDAMNPVTILVNDPMSSKDLRRQYRREQREDSPFTWEWVGEVRWYYWLALVAAIALCIVVRA
jgi:hypothetical protein